jgi:DNA repair exonuclease SbcCD ATPase subunit
MRVENFLSFKEAEFDLANAGLTLVEGENCDDPSASSNGSGKSAMIDALVWCLFGTTLRGYENDEVINRKVGDDCLVSVSFESGGDVYIIKRARRHSKWKSTLRVIHANEDISLASNAETQGLVEKLLGCSMRTFLSSVVFGQDRAYRFSSLTDKDQKDILDEVLGVERFAVAGKAARELASSIEDGLERVSAALKVAEEQRDADALAVDELHEKWKEFMADRKAKLETEEVQLAKAQKLAKDSKVDTAKLKAALDARRNSVAAAESVIAKITDEVTDARLKHGQAASKRYEMDGHLKRHQGLTGTCPTCDQKVDAKHRQAVMADISAQIAAADLVIKKAAMAMAAVDAKLADAKLKLKEFREAVVVAEKSYNDSVSVETMAKALKQRIVAHENRIAELEEEENPYAALRDKAKARLAAREKEMKLFTKQVAEEEVRLARAQFWVLAYGASGLRSLLLDTSLPLLNQEAARVSRMITGGSISIEFSATSDLKNGKTIDRFEVRVVNKHGASSYAGNSAGEKAKVDLCVGLALQRLVASRSKAKFNIAMLDEIFDHLDGAAHERVVEVLSEMSQESVFVVSHNDDLKAWFPNVLTILKENGFSRIKE